MKKLTLILAIAMLLAFAVPALAITDISADTPYSTAPAAIDLAIVNNAAYALAPISTTGFASPASYVAEGSVLTVAAYFAFEKNDDLPSGLDDTDYTIQLSAVGATPILNGVLLTCSGGRYNGSNGWITDTDPDKRVEIQRTSTLFSSTYKDDYFDPYDSMDSSYLYYYQFVAGGIPAEGGSITLKLTEYVPSALSSTKTTSFWNSARTSALYVQKASVTVGSTSYNGYVIQDNATGKYILLALDTDGRVVTGGVKYQAGSDIYTITNTHAASFTLFSSTGAVVTGTPLTDAKTLWTKVAAYFGFDYSLNGIVTDTTFLSKYPAFSLTKTVTFTSGVITTVVPTVTTPDVVVPPKTGDVASVFGFAMLAFALIAAGALLVKRVRS